MATKNMGYDHPAYIARYSHVFPALAAGASGNTSKFVAFTALQIFAAVFSLTTAGTSTSTLWNGTATVTNINGDSFSVIRITNIAAQGASPVLSTATYGPFAASLYNGTATGTQTNAAGAYGSVALSGTATTGQAQVGAPASTGGFSVNQGDQIYIVRGTDATAVTGFALEYAPTPLANVTV
jgi:hypothetical protein